MTTFAINTLNRINCLFHFFNFILHRKYTVFTATGVVGDMKGTVRNHDFNSDKAAALDYFRNQYAARTGNVWVNRQHFMKFPGRFFPVDLDDDVVRKEIN